MEALISVIVPVYKAEPYLEACLDSILNNTYRNIEVICVDDGSPDNCGAILDRYAARDSRIKVIHQENAGVSAARNAGLAIASGEYITFADSDDLVSPVLYEKLLWAMETTGADLVACEVTRKLENLWLSCDIAEENLRIVEGFDACMSVIVTAPSSRAFTWTYCVACDKLYRREKIKESFRVEMPCSEDMVFNWDYLRDCEKMAIIPKALYYWRCNPDSVTSNPTLRTRVTDACTWRGLSETANISDPELKGFLRGMAAYRAHNAMWKIAGEDREAEYSEFMAQAGAYVRKHLWTMLCQKDVEWKVRIPAVLFLLCPPLWRRIARIQQR